MAISAIIRRSDNLPEAIRNAVFALKPGEISEPVRQPNGFYLFRAEEGGCPPFQQVRDEIFNEVRRSVQFKSGWSRRRRAVNAEVRERGVLHGRRRSPSPAAAK